MPHASAQYFDASSLSVLAYAHGFTLWHYSAPEGRLAPISAEGFLEPAADLLTPGDMVLISAGDGGRVLYVTKRDHKVGTAPLC